MTDREQKVMELLPQAVELAKQQKAKGESISFNLIQRRLRIGYILSYQIIEKMEELGYVGPFTGAQGREIYLEAGIRSGQQQENHP